MSKKEEYHLTTRRTYNFRSGAFESDYIDKKEQIREMTKLMESKVPESVEQTTLSTQDMDEYMENNKNEENKFTNNN